MLTNKYSAPVNVNRCTYKVTWKDFSLLYARFICNIFSLLILLRMTGVWVCRYESG